MYSVHGWAAIWPSYGPAIKNDETFDDMLDDDKMDALRRKIADQIQDLGLNRIEQRMNPFAEIRALNYTTHR